MSRRMNQAESGAGRPIARVASPNNENTAKTVRKKTKTQSYLRSLIEIGWSMARDCLDCGGEGGGGGSCILDCRAPADQMQHVRVASAPRQEHRADSA